MKKRIYIHLVWLTGVFVAAWIAHVYTKLESSMSTAYITRAAHQKASGSEFHDQRIAVLYKSNMIIFKKYKKGPIGWVAFLIVTKRYPVLAALESSVLDEQ